MEYSLDSITEDCYEGTTVLINKFDIRDEKKLDELEQNITAVNAALIESESDFRDVDFKYYTNLHYRLFSDLYEWAGKIRTVNMSKKGTKFCDCTKIIELGEGYFKRLKEQRYLTKMPFEKFIDELTELYCALNMLHPFREGNGRSQRLFLTLLIKNSGYEIDFSKVDTDLLMIATIKAVSGDIFLLKDILRDNISAPPRQHNKQRNRSEHEHER